MKILFTSLVHAILLCGVVFTLGSPSLSGVRPAFADTVLEEFHNSTAHGLATLNLRKPKGVDSDPLSDFVLKLQGKLLAHNRTL